VTQLSQNIIRKLVDRVEQKEERKKIMKIFEQIGPYINKNI